MDVLSIFKALADESRLRIVHALRRGTFNVQELTAILELSQPTVSHHLKILQSANLVQVTKQGTWSFYSLPLTSSDTHLEALYESFMPILVERSNSGDEPLNSDKVRVEQVMNQRRSASKNFFDGVASQWRTIREQELGDSGPLEEVAKRIAPDLDIVDLGCGSGALLEKLLPRSGATIAVDYSQAMLDEAARTLGAKRSHVDLRLGYLEHLPLADHSVDVAVAHMVLHHLPEPQRALADARRVIRPLGCCIIVDLKEHNREYMRERYADHWLGFHPDQVTAWAQQAGFNETRCEFLGEHQEAFLMTLQ